MNIEEGIFMRKKIQLMVIVISAMVFVGQSWGADREQFSVGELSIGNPLVKITATGTQLNQAGTMASDIAVLKTNALAASRLSGNVAIARMTNGLIDAIGPNQMADADHGDVAWSSGAATVQAMAASGLSGNIAEARMTNALASVIQTGSFTVGAGDAAEITFAQAFAGEPDAVVLTPYNVTAQDFSIVASGVAYKLHGQVVNKTASGFSCCGCCGVKYGYAAYRL